jgi:hypothetical protein
MGLNGLRPTFLERECSCGPESLRLATEDPAHDLTIDQQIEHFWEDDNRKPALHTVLVKRWSTGEMILELYHMDRVLMKAESQGLGSHK